MHPRTLPSSTSAGYNVTIETAAGRREFNCHARHQIDMTEHPRDDVDETPDHEPQYVTVAYVTSLAELGYFESLLSAAELDFSVDQNEQASMIDHAMQTIYMVRVRPEDADRAADLIQAELARTDDDDEFPAADAMQEQARSRTGSQQAADQQIPGFDLPEHSGGWGFWPVVASLAVVGGAIAWGVTRAREQPPPAANLGPTDFWREMLNSETPWFEVTDPGSPTRRISIDRDAGLVYVWVDEDGDGQEDWRRTYQDGALVSQRQVR